MTQRKNLSLVLVAVVVVLVVLGFLMFGAGVRAQEGGGEREPSEATDSVEFSAEFQPRELVSQYASTSINGVVETAYSTDTWAPDPGADTCIFAGAGESCRESGDISSATTSSQMPLARSQYELLGIVGLTWVEGSVAAPIETGARCYLDENSNPFGTPERPSGLIRYAGNALLGASPNNILDLQGVEDGDSVSRGAETRALLILGGTLRVEVDARANFDWDAENLRAYSEVEVTYRTIKRGETEKEETLVARSECGMLMSDGTGSTGPSGVSAQSLAAPQALRLADPEAPETTDSQAQPTTAPGTPQATGFTDESSLTTGDGIDYHLLSTRELGLLDREHIGDVLTATRETGAVEGETTTARWWLYSAEAASEQVPVLEIELADATIVQVRPSLPGVRNPAPDEVSSEPKPTTTPSTTASQLPEPTPGPTAQSPAEPTSESTPTTSTESEEGTEDD